ncbi:hypothetical protein ACTXT7_005605 [Hymenolepis weldensis]
MTKVSNSWICGDQSPIAFSSAFSLRKVDNTEDPYMQFPLCGYISIVVDVRKCGEWIVFVRLIIFFLAEHL